LEQLKLIDPQTDYSVPPLTLLNASSTIRSKENEVDQSELLVETFKNFAININVVEVTRGPVVTRYEVQPAPGVKVSRIVSLADDLALSLAAPDIRIEAPIPGKSVIGIEVPNKRSTTVYAKEILESSKFRNSKNPLLIGLGRDIAGETVVADLKDMVHLLVAGATGSGKSVCMNMIISSLLFKSSPDIVKFIMIDPKVVELSIYNGIPHLLAPVVTDPKKAALTLSWVVKEMDRRYRMFAKSKSRNIESYNRWALSMMMTEDTENLKEETEEEGTPESVVEEEKPEFFPYIVVIIDELADLMMVAPGDVEDAICRLAQKARAAGIHLVLATQRPSTDVITGLIKANIPSRIAFAVSSAVDSRIILDSGGAERLLGKGDMLFHPMGASKMTRVQGAFITDKEIERLVEFLKGQSQPQVETSISLEEVAASTEEFHDELFDDAIELVLQSGQASASMLQRRFRIGYTRAARLIDMMEDRGIVGPHEGSKPRVVLISEEEWRERKEEESQ
jgi:S-DNA-T family DNA segregation ATPase FtsK/SpoIIIE